MDATTITATELSRNLSDILSRVRYKRETFVVERNGEVVATLAPPEEGKVKSMGELIEFLRSLPKPDDRFLDDLREIRASQGQMPPSPWES